MSTLFFQCPSCRATFGAPTDKIPPEGSRGRCPQCQAGIFIYRDGRTAINPSAPSPPPGSQVQAQTSQQAGAPSAQSVHPAAPSGQPAAPPSAPKRHHADADGDDGFVWELMPTGGDVPGGRLTAARIRELILDEKLVEGDMIRPMGGDWAPARSYPAISALFSERIRLIKERYGDEEHCALHPDRVPGWKCNKCGNYLCQECVLNQPLVAGGADHYVCASCETETTVVKRKSRFLNMLTKKV